MRLDGESGVRNTNATTATMHANLTNDACIVLSITPCISGLDSLPPRRQHGARRDEISDVETDEPGQERVTDVPGLESGNRAGVHTRNGRRVGGAHDRDLISEQH
jgi:hypothetical protein